MEEFFLSQILDKTKELVHNGLEGENVFVLNICDFLYTIIYIISGRLYK